MKTLPLLPIAALGLVGLGTSVFAQSGSVATSAPPAPEAAPLAETSAPLPVPNQIVYRAALPSAQEVTNAAAAQGLAVEQISQTANQVVAVYKTKNGQTMTVAYAVLPAAGGVSPQYSGTTAAVEYAPAGTVVSTAPTTTTTVVYTDPTYYDPVYSPWYYGYGWGYPGVAIGIGLGGYYYHGHYYHGGGYYHGGYYRGGYHGGGWAHPGHGATGHPGGGFHTGGGFHH